MRKIVLMLIVFITTFGYVNNINAQGKATISITSVKQKGETVRYTITSSRPFIFGNNRYVLYIGSKNFYTYEQAKKNGKGILSFLIPVKDFKELAQGAETYVTYGHVNVETTDMTELSEYSKKCWSLGKFDKALLKK